MRLCILPDSVRLNPVTLSLYEHQPKLYKNTVPADYMARNPVWNGSDNRITLRAAGNETVAFQAVIISDTPVEDVTITLKEFTGPGSLPAQGVELFKEWFVEVQEPSSGYERTTLGPGWYPDALIPLTVRPEYWGAPFCVPDYWNRVRGQKAAVIWADIYVPMSQPAGEYASELVVKAPGMATLTVPVALSIWPFSLPHRNSIRGNLFTGALKRMDEDRELRYYHMLKKHRIASHQCYYRPGFKVEKGEPALDWSAFDARLEKYFDGSAFTEKHGYSGPGAGEPMEFFLLPFNCSGKKGSVGWPLPTDCEKDEAYWKIWDKTAQMVRRHLIQEKRINPAKTEIQIFFNGLDECYKREDHERMITWSTFMKKHFPECHFRIDGGYDEETMEFLKGHVDLCLYHTGAYNRPLVEKFRKEGVRDWFYGPMVYESRTNELTGASTFIDLDLLTMRGMPWVCFKYGTDSWCQWEFAYGAQRGWYDPENFKNSDLEQFRRYNGNGMLLYDGEFLNLPDPCASIRFKAGRSGAQEFEYLKLLKDLGGDPAAIVDKLVYEPLGEKCLGVLEPWNTDLAAWDKARLELGEAISKRI